MRRNILLLAGVLLVAPSFGSDSPKECDGQVEIDGIEGTWKLVSVEDNGKASPGFEFAVIFCKGAWTSTSDQKGSYKVDAKQRPALLDWRITDPPGDQKPAKSIYRLDGDILKIAYYLEDDRPRHFDSKADDRLHVYIFTRVGK
jgi:uncharacterized protein (TIGR03067 family)